MIETVRRFAAWQITVLTWDFRDLELNRSRYMYVQSHLLCLLSIPHFFLFPPAFSFFPSFSNSLHPFLCTCTSLPLPFFSSLPTFLFYFLHVTPFPKFLLSSLHPSLLPTLPLSLCVSLFPFLPSLLDLPLFIGPSLPTYCFLVCLQHIAGEIIE